MKRAMVKLYAVCCYVLGLVSVAFYADFFVGKIWNRTVFMGAAESPVLAMMANLGILSWFALQHSLMARPIIKEQMRKFIPEPLERSTYILLSSLVIFAIYFLYLPVEIVIFDFRNTRAETWFWGFYGLGWFLTLFSTFLIDHFDLFGLKQAWSYRKEKKHAHRLVTPFLYKVIRHPIYLGWFIVHWATPYLTVGQLGMAIFFSIYIYKAIEWEEKDLIDSFGQDYLLYRKRTGKLFPPLRLALSGLRNTRIKKNYTR